MYFAKGTEVLSGMPRNFYRVTIMGGAQVQALTPPPPPPTLPPSLEPKCLRGSNHRTNQYREIGWRHTHRKILVPLLKGLGEPVTHVFKLKMLSFFSAFLLRRGQDLCSHF